MFMRVPSFFTKLYYSRIIRATIATFFSVGKVLSSAGSTLFGVKETLSAYGVNKQAGLGLSSGLTVLNVLLTTANRAPPIYRRLLKAPRLRELAQQQQQQTERYQFLGAPPPLLAIDPTVPSPRLSQEPPPFPDLPPLALSKASLRPALSVEALSPASKFLYYLLSFFGHLSLPFSALNAYLSAITLINEVYPELSVEGRLAFAGFVTSSSMMSYCTFNLAKMRRNILRFCNTVDRRIQSGGFDITTKTVLATIFSTVFGIIAGVGTAYLGTQKSLDLFPLTEDFSAESKESLVIASVIASLFSSTFIFAFSCYDQIRAHLEPHLVERLGFQIPLYARGMTLIDSTSNSTTGFIGMMHLMSRLLKVSPDNVGLIVAGLPPLLNNIYMNYCLGLIGSRSSIEWLHNQCWRAQACCQHDGALLGDQQAPALLVDEPVVVIDSLSSDRPSPSTLVQSPSRQATQTNFFWAAAASPRSYQPLPGEVLAEQSDEEIASPQP